MHASPLREAAAERAPPSHCASQRHLRLIHSADSAPAPGPIALTLNGRPDQLQLPGDSWPALTRTQALRPDRPLIGVWEIPTREAERMLIAWKHPLHANGEKYTRPLGRMFFLMEVLGRPAAVVGLASICNTWVCKKRGLSRYDCVDLARICRSPDQRDEYCLRAVLRLAREYLVPLWPQRYKRWSTIRAVCANSLPSTSSAQPDGKTGMYRFDGFERIRVTKGKGGGGKRDRRSKAAEIGDGTRGLWLYPRAAPAGTVGPAVQLQLVA